MVSDTCLSAIVCCLRIGGKVHNDGKSQSIRELKSRYLLAAREQTQSVGLMASVSFNHNAIQDR